MTSTLSGLKGGRLSSLSLIAEEARGKTLTEGGESKHKGKVKRGFVPTFCFLPEPRAETSGASEPRDAGGCEP